MKLQRFHSATYKNYACWHILVFSFNDIHTLKWSNILQINEIDLIRKKLIRKHFYERVLSKPVIREKKPGSPDDQRQVHHIVGVDGRCQVQTWEPIPNVIIIFSFTFR